MVQNYMSKFAVSYTHLDVYKRQGVEFIHPDTAMVEEMREATKSVWELEDIKNMIDPEIYEMAVQIRDN